MNQEDGTGRQPSASNRRWSWLRRGVLTTAFLLLIITPILNYFFGITFVQGWYQSFGIGEMRIISPLEGLESLLVSRQLFFPVVVGMLLPVVVALLLGRVFCSWICPISFFAEIFASLHRRVTRNKQVRDRLVLAKKILWLSLIGELLLSLILGAPIFVVLSPPGLVGRELMSALYFHRFAWEGLVVVLILLLELVTRRFYCRYFCPLGALLALFGKKRRLIVSLHQERCIDCKRCSRACPLGLDPCLDEGQGIYCWNCGTCIDSCNEQALHYIWRRTP